MDKFDYSRSVETANRLLERFGKQMVLRKAGLSAGSAYEPTRMAPTFHSVVGVETETVIRGLDGLARKVRSWYIRVQEGVVPQADDQLMISGVTSFLTNPRDALFSGDVIVGDVHPLQPGDTVVLYSVMTKV